MKQEIQQRNQLFEDELETAILGQHVHHQIVDEANAEEAPDTESSELDTTENLFLNEAADIVDGLFNPAPPDEPPEPEEDVPEDEVIIENGMSLNDFKALLTMAEDEAANYENEVQRRNANQHVRETLADLDTAAGIYGDIEGAPSRFASAENHLIQADVENDEAHRNSAMRNKMDSVGANAEKAINSAPEPIGPKGPVG